MNQIAIIDRSFLEMEILKPILVATALIGIHITQPFLTLILSKKTNYWTLVEMYPKLYKDLTSLSPQKFLTFNHICSFSPNKVHSISLPKPCILESIQASIDMYRKEIQQLMQSFLGRLAEGFSRQRRAIYGFGSLPMPVMILGQY